MSVELTEDGAERYRTAGGITVTRERHETPYRGAIEAYIDALELAPRRGVFLQLRISRPLYPLGHRDHRPAARHLGARPRHEDRGVEPARRGHAAGDRALRWRRWRM